MKYLITLFMGVTLCITGARACDVCGCSASNQYLGLLPKDFSFIGIQYQHSSFNSDHPSLFENRPNEKAQEYYNTVQLWGRYVVSKRLQLFTFVPYRSNYQNSDTGRYSSAGIGDISLLANIALIKDGNSDTKWQQQLLAGGGVKMPTGKYVGITAMDKMGLPNMQPGSGSWDFIVNANYTLRKKSIGMNVDAAFTYTTPGKESYKYGNKINAGWLAFYSIKKGDYTVLPQVGFRYEYALHDYDNYSRRWLNEQSGGYMSFATFGFQAYHKKIGAKVTYQAPLAQHYSLGYLTANSRIDAGLFFLL